MSLRKNIGAISLGFSPEGFLFGRLQEIVPLMEGAQLTRYVTRRPSSPCSTALLHHGQVLKCGPRSWRTKLDAQEQ